jgi:RHS repeat-associated protein
MQKLYYSFIVLLIGFFAKAQTTTAPISPTPAISPIGIGLFAAPIGGGGGGSYKWNADMDRDGFGDPYTYVMANTKPYGYVSNQSDYDDSTPYITNIPPQTFYRDADGDTYGSPTVKVYYSVKPTGYVTNNLDCNDGDATLNPATVWYRDVDGDGYGTSATTTTSCSQPTGYVRNASDYNDTTVNITNIAPQTFYRDVDGDGYGNPSVTVYYSVKPGGYVTNSLDCNDNDATLNPTTVWYRDADGDGYGTSATTTTSCTQPIGYVRNSSDYNDTTANITNIAPQNFYRDADNDTFGNAAISLYYSVKPAGYVTNNIDCNDSDATLNPNTLWFRDADGDGYGTSATSTASCTQPTGYVRNSSDYNDGTANITNIAPSTFYRDADGDGYGSPTVTVYYSVLPTGYVTNSSDCNDGDATLNPNTPWFRDNDGDGYGVGSPVLSCTQPTGYVRNASDYNDTTVNITNIAPSTFYRDADGDSFGSPTVTVYYSVLPSGYVTNNTDCNDGDASLNPNTLWYRDADGDGYGTSATTTTSCTQPTGYVRNSSDYNDSTVNITNIAPQTFYRDADGDGYGSSTVTVYYSVKPSGYVTNNTDCNDGDASLNPTTVWYRDADGDGYGTSATTTTSCTQPTGYVRNSSDYNDSTANITNIAPQTFYRDADGDGYGSSSVTVYYSVQPGGYVTNSLDCNDGDATLNPTTVWYRDLDGDGYGTSAVTTTSCTQPTGYVRNSSDYNDSTVNITNIAPQTFYRDADGDGYGSSTVTVFYSVKPSGYVTNNTDCNDGDASLNPTTVWYRDADNDGFGSTTVIATQCAQPIGYIRTTGDFDDSTVNITNIAPQTFYRDADGDGYGSPTVTVYYSVKPTGYVTNTTDCNDGDATLNPNTVWYRDTDGDGYGTSATTTTSCTQPTGYVRNSSDFDDSTTNITNIAPQTFYRDADGDTFGSTTVSVYYSAKPTGYVTNNSDYDDGTVNITNIAPQTFYADSDGDGFGNLNVSLYYSVMPTGYVTNSTDCDDVKSNINPNTKWYADVDGDGLGDAASFVTQCTAPVGYVLDATDHCPDVPGTNADCGALANPSQDLNYIISRNYKQASATPLVSPSPEQAQVQITYFDGLGRPMQQIANQQSATGKDIVTPIEYDSFGRQPKDYLPFVGSSRNMAYDSNSIGGNLNYYTSTYSTSIGFSEKLLEKSPLNRVLEQAAPGDDWRLSNPDKHTIQLGYQTNTADEVQRFDVSLTADYVPSITSNGSYDANVLYKTVTTDENNHSTEEFKDKEGHVVLKRNYDTSVAHDTYYVYDVYGNLTYVLPPKAEGASSATVLDELCYQYQYDYRNRLVAKKLPGKQWEFMVYDKLDRVVATGPAFSPFSDLTTSGWLITKYDAFNRVVYTGWLNSLGVNDTERSTMQQSQNTATTINETKQTSGTIDSIAVNYSNNVVPTTFKLLSVNYYDTYAIPNLSGLATSVEGQTATTATKGLATGSWTRVPTTSAEVKAETNYVLYDAKFRPIRSYTTNYLGGFTCTDSKLDAFSGQLQYTLQKHKRTSGDAELTVKEAFTYSAQNRLLTHTHQINGGTEQLLADNTYDELGKLTSKKVGNTSTTPLQNVNYTYNVRGWLTKINEISNLQQGTDPADLFSFKLNYNTIDGSTGAADKLYNGNIAETFWSTTTDGGFVRNYGYKYDSLNRLKDATYQKSGQLTNMYNENLSYDKNGNIMNLSRYGDRDEQYLPIQIDYLQYGYATNSNKLMSVVDNSNNTSGFEDGNTTEDDYAYDANGNMTVDNNKHITSITYNHLNLPTQITFGTTGNIVYIYTASGQKVQKVVTENATVTTTDYLGGYQYQNTVLQFFPTAEGYVKNTPVSGTNAYSYVFNYTDHLGNVRLSYTKDATTSSLKILEESNYYPFGLKHSGYNPIAPVQEYKYRYNSKEYQDELGLNWYSYGYRHYDPAIARWTTMDPLLNDLKFSFDDKDVDEDDEDEVYQALVTKLETGDGIFNTDNLNPYGYGYNNPISFDDPDGRCPVCIYVVAALLYSEFANAPTGNGETDSRNYEASKGNRTIVSETVLKRGGNLLPVSATKSNKIKSTTEKSNKSEKTYQTYTKENKKTGETYSGRTSGKGTPKENVAKRDGSHHKNKDGFGPAKLDKSSKNKDAIRGREQKLIDKNGKAKSEGGTSGNSVRGVSPKNPNATKYEEAARKEFGN